LPARCKSHRAALQHLEGTAGGNKINALLRKVFLVRRADCEPTIRELIEGMVCVSNDD
jgi:hypothetical protein